MGFMITFLTEKIKLHKQKSETTIILLPTLLPNLFIVDYKWLQNFTEMVLTMQLVHFICRKGRVQPPTRKGG